MPDQETLYYYTHSIPLTYQNALQILCNFCDDNEIAQTTVLAYGADRLLFDGWAEIMAKKPYPFFHLRAFNTTAELRWNRNQNDLGQFTILTDHKPKDIKQGNLQLEPYKYEPLIRNYLVWGRYDPSTLKLFDGRIGHITIPDHVIKERDYDKGTRLYVTAKEYISTDEYGNAHVCEERLTTLEMRRKS